jgi:hypothetical protein
MTKYKSSKTIYLCVCVYIYTLNINYPAKYSKLSVYRLCLPPAFTLVSCSAYSSTLKMEAIWSSETTVDFQRTTRRYISEDITLHNPM